MLGPEWELTLESGQELACNPVVMLAQCMCCWPRVPGGQGVAWHLLRLVRAHVIPIIKYLQCRHVRRVF